MKNRKTFRLTAVTVIICILAGLVYVFPAGAAQEYTDTQLQIKLEAGYNSGCVHPGYNRLSLSVTNQTGRDIEGYAEITANNWYSGSGSNTIRIDLSVADGVSKTCDTVADISSYGLRNLTVSVCSDSGKVLRTQSFSYDTLSTDIDLHIGWLCDTVSEGKLMTSVNDDYFISGTAALAEILTPDAFPADLASILDFDWIIVNNADLSASSAFSQKQLDLLRAYLNAGGTVLVGTGDNSEILQFFSEYFSGNVSKAVSTATCEDFCEYCYNTCFSDGLKEYSLKIESPAVLSLSDASFTKAFRTSKYNGITYYKHNNCNLYISSINLASKALVNYAYAGQLLTCSFVEAGADYGSADKDNYVKSGILGLLVQMNINYLVITLIMLAYTGAGIILPYVMARKKKKSRIAWLGIPAASLLFSLIVFAYSGISRAGTSGLEVIGITELYDGGNSISSYSFCEVSASGGNRRYTLDADNVIYSDNGNNDGGITVSTGSEPGLVISSEPWGAGYGYAVTSETSDGVFALTYTENSDGTVNLKVTNSTGKDYTKLVLYCYGNTLLINELKAGDSVSFDSISTSLDSPDLESIIANLYYTPLGLSTKKLSNQMPNTNYQYYYTDYSDYFSDLRKSSYTDYLSAIAVYTLLYGHNIYNSYSKQCSYDCSDTIIFGIESNPEIDILVNGKKRSGADCTRLVYQTFDGPEPNYSQAIGNTTGTAYISGNSQGLDTVTYDISLVNLKTALLYTSVFDKNYLKTDAMLYFYIPEGLDPAEWTASACILSENYITVDLTEEYKSEDGEYQISLKHLKELYGTGLDYSYDYYKGYYEIYDFEIMLPSDEILYVNGADGIAVDTDSVLLCVIFSYTGENSAEKAECVDSIKYKITVNN